MNKPKVYIMVGLPASGKSTWINNQAWVKDCAVVSTDHYVEKFARRLNTTYNNCFESVMPRAVRLMIKAVEKARSQEKDIIWDQTSLSVESRKKKFRMLPNYYHIAIIVRAPKKTVLLERISQRPGKIIPKNVLEDMENSFVEPTEEEGYKEIWYV